MNSNSPASRREFLRMAAQLSMTGVAAPFALNLAALGSAAAAQSSVSDYKALVCLFLYGGNDSHNMVIATDNTSFTGYTTQRTTMALAQSTLLPITVPNLANPGRSFALHSSMAPIQSLISAGRAAIVSNVGPLIAPMTKAQWNANSVVRPKNLFSHNDQQSTWQAFSAEGTTGGWGGRIGDMFKSQNTKNVFTCVSAAGNAVFMSGLDTVQYQVSSSGAVPIGNLTGTALFGSTAAANPLTNILTASRTNLFEKEQGVVTTRSITAQTDLLANMLPAGATGIANPTQYTNPNTGTLATNTLAQQFQTVARVIGGNAGLGIKRQVFFVSLGGFDTHDFQLTAHNDLYARIAHAMNYFDTTLGTMGLRNKVTTFTASDFGRTAISNGDGSDHGWGSHHMVFGAGVKPDVYGTFPAYTNLGLDINVDVGSGRLLPNLSVDQYGATLAKWFGVDNANLSLVFPNLGNFATKDLGFML